MKSISFICLVLCILSFKINASNPNITTVTKVKDFSMGLTLGLGALAYMPEATQCVTQSSTLINNIQSLLSQIKNLKPSQFFKLISALKQVNEELIQDIVNCHNLPTEGKTFFKNIADHFTNSTQILEGFDNIVINYDQVKMKLSMAVKFIKKGDQETDYLTAGAMVGQIIDIYVNGVQDLESINDSDLKISTITKVKDFTMGLTLGLGALNAMPEATSCVMESSVLVSNVKSLISQIKHINVKKIGDLVQALVDVNDELLQDVVKCHKLPSEGKAFFSNIVGHFTNGALAKQGLINVLQNSDQVESKIKMAAIYFKKGEQETDYLTAGALVGQCINIYVNGAQDQQNLDHIKINIAGIKDFVVGFNKGMRIRYIPEVASCIMQSKTLVSEFEHFIADVKHFSVWRIKSYLQEQGQMIKQMFNVVSRCKSVPRSVKYTFQKLERHFTDKNLIKQGVINILRGSSKVISEIHTSIADIKSQRNLEQAGYYLGDVIMTYVGRLNSNENQFVEKQ